ncbi:MAG: class I SAM-dependent methyltransferase, partial [Bacteroidota bacterium]
SAQTMSAFHCPYCNSDHATAQYGTQDIFGDAYELLACDDCETIYLHPPPSEEALAQAYAEDYYGEGEQKFNPVVEKILGYFRNKRARLLHRLMGGQGNILDIGCGNGQFLALMRSIGPYAIHGLELPGKAAQRAGQVEHLQLKLGALAQEDYPAASFDAVTLFHVFEHLPNPHEILTTVQRILKPNGILVMSFPNIGSWQAHHFKGDWLHLDPPRHLFFMTPEKFREIMADHGFELLKETHFAIEYNPFGMQQSLLNRWLSKRDVLYEVLKGNTEYAKEFSSWQLTLQRLFFLASFPLFILTDALVALRKRGATVEFVLRKKRE